MSSLPISIIVVAPCPEAKLAPSSSSKSKPFSQIINITLLPSLLKEHFIPADLPTIFGLSIEHLGDFGTKIGKERKSSCNSDLQSLEESISS
jgi:hypothetical protein